MQHVRLFTWWRLFLLLWLLAAAGLWVRSYHRADGLNYRTAAGTHLNIRGQYGVLAFEVIDESAYPFPTGAGPKLWFISADGVCDTRRWGDFYFMTTRAHVLGFIWIAGTYGEIVPLPDVSPKSIGHHDYQIHLPAHALAIPFWFLVALPAALLTWLLSRALRLRHRLRVGHCPVCGYDLRASPTRCPECGRATDAPAAP